MKYIVMIASNLYLNLILCNAQEIMSPTYNFDVYAQNDLHSITSSEFSSNNSNQQKLDESHLRAPNSYIYDVNLAKTQGFGGLKIPVKKAFEMWSSPDWYLNEPLGNSGQLSAYLYWEDTYGLIEKVEMEPHNPLENSKIKVFVNPKKGKGNAVISLHKGSAGNQNDPIVWTWHVWVTDDPSNGIAFGQDMETDINGKPFTPEFMDRNLGAVYNKILGHEWHKTSGLMYQWGRKDPFPPMVHKDFSFYELNGLVGFMRNREGVHNGNILPEIMRPYDDITSNIRYSVRNPIHLIKNSDIATWFSAQQYRIPDNPNTQYNETIAWDLWSDNMRGENSNSSSSDPNVRADSRSYELKSPFDPCPNGWRIPSHLGRNTVNNIHSPFGRKNSGTNDDTNPDYNMFYPNQQNDVILNAKVYSGLGIDFSDAVDINNNSRKIGVFPTTGYYVYYPSTNSIVFQDNDAISALWTATYSLGGARYFRVVTDPNRPDIGPFGLNQILVNQTSFSMEAMAVRCIKDPNRELIPDFQTEYIPTNRTYFTAGLNNPNSYVVSGDSDLVIPVSKAFSAYEYIFPDRESLPADNLIANVYWTDNPNLIQTVKVIKGADDPRLDYIHVSIDPQQRGNAVVSLHNGSINNPVYWSWHIWAIHDEIEGITYVNQEPMNATHHFINATGSDNPPLTTIFMDRNLGALNRLPIEIKQYPDLEVLQNEVKNSGGLHYQWGRKDPIPSFRYVGGETYEIYRGTSVNSNGVVSYSPINALNYKSQFTEDYSVYKNYADVKSTDNKYQEADKILWYSVQNPLTLLHKGTTESSDWISGESSLGTDRWGHGTKKSIFDPCPKDWRVADTFKVYENGKGNSPWFNGKKGGSLQGVPQPISTHYGGEFFSHNNKAVGWFFNDSDYSIGHFPATGIIGKFSPNEIGGTSVNNAITGIWTSAQTQQMKGHALAMTMGVLDDSGHKMISLGNVSPSYALNVRCALDERRYVGDLGEDEFPMNVRDFSSFGLDGLKFYPNPVVKDLNVSVNKEFKIDIYDLNGRLVLKGKFENQKINLSNLTKGVYVALISYPDSQETLNLKLIKQ